MTFLLAFSLFSFVGERVESVWLAGPEQGLFRFEPGMVVAGTDSVWVDGRLLAEADYALDASAGTVLLARPAAEWSVVRLACRKVVFSGSRPEYRLQVPDTTHLATDTIRYVAAAEEPEEGAAGVGLSGTKTLGVSLGGLDAGINQSTSLAVTGEVEGIRITGELSDQSEGIATEGTSTALEDLDQIAIALDARNWLARFGDVVLAADAGGLGRVERRSLGGRVEYRPGPLVAELGYARPRGTFGRVELSGQDRVQGPYVLAPDGRSAQLVPGSEEVFLDGRRMTRGWDQDYTVDYSSGELEFTNRHIITAESRIEADFQYVTEEYQRQDLVAGLGWQAGGLRVDSRFFQEGDDANRPLAEELTEDQREYLAGIGSDTSKAWLDGALYTGDSAGDYVFDSAVGGFRYAGPDQGDYDVRFTFVGDSAGDYEYSDSLAAYEFRGAGNGGYVPKVRVTLPERQDVVVLGAQFRGAGFDLKLAGAGVRRLANLFAAGGAPAATGAGLAEAGWERGAFRAGYRARLQAEGFALPGADTAKDFSYRWAGASLQDVRMSHEVSLGAKAFGQLELGGEAGWLRQHAGATRLRYQLRADNPWLALSAGQSGQEQRYAAGVHPALGRFSPRAGASLRLDEDARQLKPELGLGVRLLPSLGLDAGYEHLLRDSTDSSGTRAPADNGGTVSGGVGWQPGDGAQVAGRASWQYRRFPGAPAEDWSQWLGNVSASYAPRAGIALRADLDQSSRLVQLRDEVFRYVGAGEGEYARDSVTGRYYPDPEGDYERLLVARGRFASAVERSANASFSFGSWQPLELAGSGSYSAASDTAPIQELASYDARLAVRAFEPLVTPALGVSGSTSLDRTLALTGKRSDNYRLYADAVSSAWPVADLRVSGARTQTGRRYDSGLTDYSESGWSVELEPALKVEPKLALRARLAASAVEQPLLYPELGRFALYEREVELSRSFVLAAKLRATAGLSLVQVAASVAELPFEVALGRPLGLTPGASLAATQLLSDVLSASLSYRFSNRPDRAADHRLSAELRATF